MFVGEGRQIRSYTTLKMGTLMTSYNKLIKDARVNYFSNLL